MLKERENEKKMKRIIIKRNKTRKNKATGGHDIAVSLSQQPVLPLARILPLLRAQDATWTVWHFGDVADEEEGSLVGRFV